MPKLHRLRDVDPVAIALCRQGANGQRIFLRKSEGELVTIAKQMPLHKAAADGWSTLYCVVAQPNLRENGGLLDPDKVDVWDSPDEIRKAAHRLMKNRGVVNVEHGEAAEATIVESAVALSPIRLADVTVPEGAWYVGIEPSDELRKAYDAGDLTGVSLEGTGTRVEVEEDEPTELAKSVLTRLAEALGLRDRTGTLAAQSDEETDVADITELKAEVAEIAKAQSATTTAIEGLVETVNKLMDHFGSAEKRKAKAEDAKAKSDDEVEEPKASDIKKAIDELTETFASKLDDLDAQVAKLSEGESAQDGRGDQIKKKANDDPLAGLLD